jgi:hypothetical protein
VKLELQAGIRGLCRLSPYFIERSLLSASSAGFVANVSGFRFQVAGFKLQVSSCRFGMPYLEISNLQLVT